MCIHIQKQEGFNMLASTEQHAKPIKLILQSTGLEAGQTILK